MKAREAEFIVVDFESTGSVRGHTDEAWQVGMVRLSGGKIQTEAYSSYLRIGDRPFNPYAPGRHAHIRGELASAPAPAECWPEWQAWLTQRIPVAHNVGTEKKFLKQAAPMHLLGNWVDTLQLARKTWPGLAGYSLATLCAQAGLEPRIRSLCPDRDWHDALFDAFACAALLEWFLDLPDWQNLSLEAVFHLSGMGS